MCVCVSARAGIRACVGVRACVCVCEVRPSQASVRVCVCICAYTHSRVRLAEERERERERERWGVGDVYFCICIRLQQSSSAKSQGNWPVSSFALNWRILFAVTDICPETFYVCLNSKEERLRDEGREREKASVSEEIR